MKKAKQYADEFIAAGKTVEALAEVLDQMIQETAELMKKRLARTDAGCLAVFNEIDDKFRAFARIVGNVSPDSFAYSIQKMFPDVYRFWTTCFPHRRTLQNPAREKAAEVSLSKTG